MIFVTSHFFSPNFSPVYEIVGRKLTAVCVTSAGTTPCLIAAAAQLLACKEVNLAPRCSGVMMLAMSPPGPRSCAIQIRELACHRRFLALGIAVSSGWRVAGNEKARVCLWLGFGWVAVHREAC